MIDSSILNDRELIKKAREERNRQSREFIKKKRADFKKEHGISYDMYLRMKKLKEGR